MAWKLLLFQQLMISIYGDAQSTPSCKGFCFNVHLFDLSLQQQLEAVLWVYLVHGLFKENYGTK